MKSLKHNLAGIMAVLLFLYACAVAYAKDGAAIGLDLSQVDIRQAVKNYQPNTSLIALVKEPILPVDHLPKFKDGSLFGVVRLGANRTPVYILVEKHGSGKNATYQVLFDNNANGDLTDDFPLTLSAGKSAGFWQGESVIRNSEMAYRLVYTLETGENNYLKYYITTGRAGNVGSGKKKARFVLIDGDGDGCYNNKTEDKMIFDLNTDGVLDGGADSSEVLSLDDSFAFEAMEWRISGLLSDGSRVTFSRNAPGMELEPEGESRPEVGYVAPLFSDKTLNGKTIALKDYRGKIVLLDFWASWCSPCRAEIPHLVDAYKRFNNKGFEIIGINLDNSADQMQAFVKAQGMEWPQIFDARDQKFVISELYGVQSIPTTYLVGRDGKIIAANLRGNRLAIEVEQALKR